MAPLDMLAAALLAAGCFFIVTGSVGALRMPDFYSRIHPAGQGDTMGQVLVLAGVMVHYGANGEFQAILKLILIVLFLAITAPTATHAMARGAALSGLKPWQRKDAPK